MESLRKLTRAIWEARKTLSFGEAERWDQDCFLLPWVSRKDASLWMNKPGWYWIESSLSRDDFATMELPDRLPAKAIRFSEIAQENLRRFDRADLHATVAYSGQEARVFTRLRGHFSLSLNNTATGALGIASYPLSSHRWHASFFHSGMISSLTELTDSERARLAILSADTHSRDLVEACWRIEYGWPILCQK